MPVSASIRASTAAAFSASRTAEVANASSSSQPAGVAAAFAWATERTSAVAPARSFVRSFGDVGAVGDWVADDQVEHLERGLLIREVRLCQPDQTLAIIRV